MQKKGQTKKSVSAVVFTNIAPNFLGVGYKNVIVCWNPPPPNKKRALSIFRERKKGQKCEKGWAENLSNYVAQHNWTDFQLNKMCFLFIFIRNRILLAERGRFLKKKWKRKKKEILDRFQLKIWQFLDRFSAQTRAILDRFSDRDRESERCATPNPPTMFRGCLSMISHTVPGCESAPTWNPIEKAWTSKPRPPQPRGIS